MAKLKPPLSWSIDYLSRWESSVSSFRDKLLRKGYSQIQADETCDRLVELEILNDKVYSQHLRERMLRQAKSKQYILRKLFYKGVSAEIVANVLEEVSKEEYQAVLNEFVAIRSARYPAEKVYRQAITRGWQRSEALLAINTSFSSAKL